MTSVNLQRLAGLGCALSLASCAGASTAVGASSMTALALGASAAERAAGGCYAVCTNGTACNPRSGLCEVQPCRNQCAADEHCEQSFTGERCAPGGGTTGVAAQAKGPSGSKFPVRPANTTESGPPVVVPAAEQHPPEDKSEKQ